MEKKYNKLVRDKIPEIIKSNNENPKIKILEESEYKKELERKLYEEYQEVLTTTTSEERIEELADMIEIISYLAKVENKTLEDVIKTANEKRRKRGGFDNRIYLEKVLNIDSRDGDER